MSEGSKRPPFREVRGNGVHFNPDADAPCPCGSERSYGACHPKGIGASAALSTTPKGSPSGMVVEGCYAAPLNDCGGKLSREHWLSEVLLRYISKLAPLEVAGLPGIGDGIRSLPPNAVASKILCERHNSALSPLDGIALKIFRAFHEQSDENAVFVFNGHDIERWLLKVLCGLHASGFPDVPKAERAVNTHWVEILFGRRDFDGVGGVYVLGHHFQGRGVAIRAIYGSGKPTGLCMWIAGLELALTIAGWPDRTFDDRTFAHRPFEIYTSGERAQRSVVCIWEGPADNGTISLRSDEPPVQTC
jgi:hypothetical protein